MDYKFRGKPVRVTAFGTDFVYGDKFESACGKVFIIPEDHRVNTDHDTEDVFWLVAYIIEVHPESVGMWTGLKDKKGVDVYEGDIFKSLLQIGVIKQKEGCWIVDWVKRPNALIEKLYPHVEDGEVAGNIHENKELLNDTE